MITNVIHGMPAGVAHTTSDLGHEDHLITYRERFFHVRSHFGYYTRDFVPLDDGIAGVGVLAVPNMNIRAAYPNPLNLDQDFIWSGCRLLNFLVFNSPRSGHYCLLDHGACLSIGYEPVNDYTREFLVL